MSHRFDLNLNQGRQMYSPTAYFLEYRDLNVCEFIASSDTRAKGKAAKLLRASGNTFGKLYLAATENNPQKLIANMTSHLVQY